MVAGGADIIELGVPFSDPSADGPVIQKAGDKALALWHRPGRRCWPWCALPPDRHHHPVVLMGYANPVERYDQKHATLAGNRAAPLCATLRLRRRGRCADRRLPARRMRGLCRRPARPRHGPDLPAGPHQHRRAHGAGGARGQRLCVLRVAQGRDRLRRAGHRRGGSHAAAHPPACQRAGGRGLWHPRCGHGPGHLQGGRRGGHWQQDHPADRRPATRQGGARLPGGGGAFLREIRRARRPIQPLPPQRCPTYRRTHELA
jgi:hypothetical protein